MASKPSEWSGKMATQGCRGFDNSIRRFSLLALDEMQEVDEQADLYESIMCPWIGAYHWQYTACSQLL